MLVIDLDAPHERADEVAPGRPVRLVQLVADQGSERFQLADDGVVQNPPFLGYTRRAETAGL